MIGQIGGIISISGSGVSIGGLVAFVRVLRMPCRGRYMCPLAVAVLGLRYLRINVLVMFGHPLRNPRRTALRSIDILGLQRDWWANLTVLACVCTECVKVANVACRVTESNKLGMCRARSKQGPVCDKTTGTGAVHTPLGMGNVHKSVDGSLYPCEITLPL